MKVTRCVSSYSNSTDKLIQEINIDIIPLDMLRSILKVDSDDMEVYNIYPLTKFQLEQLSAYVPELIELNVENDYVCAECFQQ